MNTLIRSAAVCAVAALVGSAGLARAQTPTAEAPATQPSDLKAKQAEVRAATAKLREAKAAYAAAFAGPKSLAALRIPAEREKLKATLPTLAANVTDAEKQLATARAALPAAPGRTGITMKTPSLDVDAATRSIAMIAIGDADAIAKANAAATGPDAAAALAAKSHLAAAAYFTSDASDAQLRAATTLKTFLAEGAANPQVDIVGALVLLTPSNADVADQVAKAVSDGTPGPFTRSILRQRESVAYIKTVENKPAVLAGNTVDGKAFTSESLKGKVILIDFWATWCGPCKAELPRIKALYAKYREQGFEIIGVSSDRSKTALTDYLANDKEMTWTNLYEEPIDEDSTMHPIAQQYKISAIPRYFLIDRNGILRSADARKDLEVQIPKLLEEKAAEKAASAG